MDNHATQRDEVDAIQTAVSTRLSRLGTIPVDTSYLDQRLWDQIPMPHQHRRFLVFGWVAGAGAAACAALIIALAMLFTGTPRLSAAELAGLYRNISTHSTLTATAGTANSGVQMAPRMICMLKSGETASCCQQMVGKYCLACVAVQSPSHARVVMVAGDVGTVKNPRGQTITIAGNRYTLDRLGHINMLMRRVGRHWYCAMGSEKPVTLAGYLRRLASGTRK
ncbi:MAG: hypothetical protein ACP5VQ_01835 [Phycisphaerae bacterium]